MTLDGKTCEAIVPAGRRAYGCCGKPAVQIVRVASGFSVVDQPRCAEHSDPDRGNGAPKRSEIPGTMRARPAPWTPEGNE